MNKTIKFRQTENVMQNSERYINANTETSVMRFRQRYIETNKNVNDFFDIISESDKRANKL